MKYVNVNVKIRKCKNDYSWNLSTCIFDNTYLKSIADASVIACDEFISVMETVSTIKTIAADISIN